MKNKDTEIVSEVKKDLKITGNSPAEMIRMAVEGKADLASLEKLLALQKDYEANEARKIFASSFASAQANIASVIKTKLNPQTHSKYADLADIIESAQPIYTKEGFSVIFYQGETTVPENVRICADVLHRSGHKETYYYDVPLDGKGIQGNANMTKIHGKGSSTSYGRRYLMCMIWNIPTQDDDGKTTIKCITEEQETTIQDLITALNGNVPKSVNMDKFLFFMKIKDIKEIPETDYQKAINVLEAVKAKQIEKGFKF